MLTNMLDYLKSVEPCFLFGPIITPCLITLDQDFIQAQFPEFQHSWGQECPQGKGIVICYRKKYGNNKCSVNRCVDKSIKVASSVGGEL